MALSRLRGAFVTHLVIIRPHTIPSRPSRSDSLFKGPEIAHADGDQESGVGPPNCQYHPGGAPPRHAASCCELHSHHGYATFRATCACSLTSSPLPLLAYSLISVRPCPPAVPGGGHDGRGPLLREKVPLRCPPRRPREHGRGALLPAALVGRRVRCAATRGNDVERGTVDAAAACATACRVFLSRRLIRCLIYQHPATQTRQVMRSRLHPSSSQPPPVAPLSPSPLLPHLPGTSSCSAPPSRTSRTPPRTPPAGASTSASAWRTPQALSSRSSPARNAPAPRLAPHLRGMLRPNLSLPRAGEPGCLHV